MIVRAGCAAVLALLATLDAGGTAAASPRPVPAQDAKACLSAPGVAHTRTVTTADRGRRVSVPAGRCLRLDLLTAVDGGYGWVITGHPDHAVAHFVSKRLVAFPHAAGTAGFPYHSYYRFAVRGGGTTTIRLVEQQSFGSHSVAARFSITLHGTR